MPGAAGSAVPVNPPVAGGDRPVPIQGQMPPPRYPPAALRRGDAGDVVVRVDVDAAGNPGGVTLVQRSGSRDLDRAAMEAVRHWRFHPAQRNGQPVAGSMDIPFEFAGAVSAANPSQLILVTALRVSRPEVAGSVNAPQPEAPCCLTAPQCQLD